MTPLNAAKEVLDQFRVEFISDMDAVAVVYDLLDKGTINDGDKNKITKEDNRDEQNKILHLILKQKCTNKDLMDACDMIIAVKGNPRMTALGEAMKRALVASKCVCDVYSACMCLCVHVHVPVCMWCVLVHTRMLIMV